MPRFRDLLNYCERNGWELYKDTDHYYYRKLSADGVLLRTKVSHALAREIPPGLFQIILKQQLHTTKAEFNKNCSSDIYAG